LQKYQEKDSWIAHFLDKKEVNKYFEEVDKNQVLISISYHTAPSAV